MTTATAAAPAATLPRTLTNEEWHARRGWVAALAWGEMNNLLNDMTALGNSHSAVSTLNS